MIAFNCLLKYRLQTTTQLSCSSKTAFYCCLIGDTLISLEFIRNSENTHKKIIKNTLKNCILTMCSNWSVSFLDESKRAGRERLTAPEYTVPTRQYNRTITTKAIPNDMTMRWFLAECEEAMSTPRFLNSYWEYF